MKADIYQHINQDIKNILLSSKNIAVIGASANESRPSHQVAHYLQKVNYNIIPVNPKYEQLLDTKCYPDLKSISSEIDIVDIFRKPDHVLPVVREAIEINAKVIWMQLGVINEEAAQLALDNGLRVVMDKCMKIEHMKIS